METTLWVFQTLLVNHVLEKQSYFFLVCVVCMKLLFLFQTSLNLNKVSLSLSA